MSLRIRHGERGDVHFIVDSWRKDYAGAPAVRGADREHYHHKMGDTIARLLEKAEVRVFCDAEDPDTFVAWVAFTGRELHWGHVKKDFRNMCKLGDLLEGVPIDAYTFRGKALEEFLIGYEGCRYAIEPDGRRTTWVPPKGWRFTPRI